MQPLSLVLPFQYDFERVIDDFVFLCFFVGNDFLPHLPSLDIRDGALDFLILIYAKLLPAMGGYLTDAGEVNLSRVDVILAEVGAVEDIIFQRRAIKHEENERRRKSRLSNEKRDQLAAAAAKNDAVEIVKKRRIDKDVIAADKKYGGLTAEEAVKARIKENVEAQLEKYRDEVQDVVRLGEPGWKTRYYSDKMKADDIEHGGGREKVFQTYIEGLCWVMKYYYSGCASWQWFYPFHYAPFASDLRNIDRFTISFTEGQPFRPFEQLMGVFPSGSSHAIPKPYRWLMSESESPIIDFYPKEIPVDPNGKAMPWLWVVLLPFIDEARLLAAMQAGNEQLTEAEKKRNERFGREIVFFHSKCPVTDSPPTAENPQVLANPKISESFNGTLTYVESVHFPIGCIVPSPEKSQQHLQDIPNNQCYSFQFQLPPRLAHVCRILDGAEVPAPVLITPNDRQISIPFFGKANINIIDLAGAANGAALTNVRQSNFGGGGGRGGGRGGYGGRGGGYNNNYQQQQQGNYSNNNLNLNRYSTPNQGSQYNQYLTNGAGHWGSQEPRNKHGQYVGLSEGSYNYNGGGGGGRVGGNYSQYPYQQQQQRGGYNNSGGRGGYSGGGGYSNSGGYGGSNSGYGGNSYGAGSGSRNSGSGSRIQSAFGGDLQPAQSFSSSSTAAAAPAPRGIEALKAGLRNMHQQRGSLPNSGSSNRSGGQQQHGSNFSRYDR